MPSFQICHHSLKLRRYSAGCTTSGVGILTSDVDSVECTEISGCRALMVCNDSNGIVGTSSACTESAITICEEIVGFGSGVSGSLCCTSSLVITLSSWLYADDSRPRRAATLEVAR